jgi:O-antigen ligase
VIVGTAIVLFFHRRDRYRLLRNALMVSGAIGFLLFALFPVAPLRMLDLGLADTVTEQSHSYRALQPPGLTNQYAAFPACTSAERRRRHRPAHDHRTPAVRLFAVAFHCNGVSPGGNRQPFRRRHRSGLVVVLVGLAVAYTIERRNRAATLHLSGSAVRVEVPRRRAVPVSRRASRGQQSRRFYGQPRTSSPRS